MIERYSIKEIDDIWSDENKIQVWWKIEVEILKSWNKLKVIPSEELKKILSNAKINYKRMLELEKETKHDVVAFTRMISESLGDEKRWIHLGATSTDIVDSAQNYLIKNSWEILNNEFDVLINVIKQKAIEHKNTIIMGRSHGIYGEPTSFGLKFLLWFDELNRQKRRIADAINDVCVIKISGSMGNFANIDINIEEDVAKSLKMNYDKISTQVSQRDRHCALFLAFSNAASTFEKIATEIRLLQRSEVNEVNEGFDKNQKGSSSMPHKKNPISSENITGISRIIKSYSIISLENNVLWHERDISHSSNERIMIPDSFNLMVYVVKRLSAIINNLYINKKQMLENINKSNNIFYSQAILTEIIKTNNVSREKVYDFIQKASQRCLDENKNFIDILFEMNINIYLSKQKINEICKLEYFIKNVDKIYKRVIG